jgi:LmbE family N-acetylglucosaminyl deacetylase
VGSLALTRRRAQLTVILATSGDAGRIADASLATRQTRERPRPRTRPVVRPGARTRPAVPPASGRRRERDPRGELVAEVRGVLEGRLVVVTPGPDGITGHDDHVAIGAIVTEAFAPFGVLGRGGVLEAAAQRHRPEQPRPPEPAPA